MSKLDAEQVAHLLKLCLKPDEIAVGSDKREARVDELLHWFLRYSRKEANPKWADGHTFELAYYIATGSSLWGIPPPKTVHLVLDQDGSVVGAHLDQAAADRQVERPLFDTPGLARVEVRLGAADEGLTSRRMANLYAQWESELYDPHGATLSDADFRDLATGFFVAKGLTLDEARAMYNHCVSRGKH